MYPFLHLTIRRREGFTRIPIQDYFNDDLSRIKKRFADELVLQPRFSGLGDHLFYSRVPELVKRLNIFKKVYISNHASYRFDGIRQLVWDINPFIDGYTDQTGWAHSGLRPMDGNFVDGMLDIFSGASEFSLGESPVVYYKPHHLPKYNSKVIVDLRSFSNRDTPYSNCIKGFLSRYDKRDIAIFSSNGDEKFYHDYERLDTETTLMEYCDIIHSALRFHCLYSGGNSLAPAIGKRADVFVKRYDPAQSYKLNSYILL